MACVCNAVPTISVVLQIWPISIRHCLQSSWSVHHGKFRQTYLVMLHKNSANAIFSVFCLLALEDPLPFWLFCHDFAFSIKKKKIISHCLMCLLLILLKGGHGILTCVKILGHAAHLMSRQALRNLYKCRTLARHWIYNPAHQLKLFAKSRPTTTSVYIMTCRF